MIQTRPIRTVIRELAGDDGAKGDDVAGRVIRDIYHAYRISIYARRYDELRKRAKSDRAFVRCRKSIFDDGEPVIAESPPNLCAFPGCGAVLKADGRRQVCQSHDKQRDRRGSYTGLSPLGEPIRRPQGRPPRKCVTPCSVHGIRKIIVRRMDRRRSVWRAWCPMCRESQNKQARERTKIAAVSA